MKTPRDFMLDDLDDEQAKEEWLHYLDNLVISTERQEDDDDEG